MRSSNIVLIILFLCCYNPTSGQTHCTDFELPESCHITNNIEIEAEDGCGNIVFDGLVFDSVTLSIESSRLGVGYDTIVIRNCTFLNYEENTRAINVRGTHKYIQIEHNYFETYIDTNSSNFPIAISASAEVALNDRVGELIINDNFIKGNTTAFFGQKLSKLRYHDNCLNLEAKSSVFTQMQAILIRAASGKSPYSEATDVIFENNTIDVPIGFSAFTLASLRASGNPIDADGHWILDGETRGVIIRNNWMNNRVYIFFGVPELVIENNTFDVRNLSRIDGRSAIGHASLLSGRDIKVSENKFLFDDPSSVLYNPQRIAFNIATPNYIFRQNEIGEFGRIVAKSNSKKIIDEISFSIDQSTIPNLLRLDWDNEGDSYDYLVEYANDLTFTSPSIDTAAHNNWEKEIASNEEVYVRIMVRDGATEIEEGFYSQVYSIKNNNTPVNITSETEYGSSNAIATLDWQSVAGAADYTIEYDTVETFTNAIVNTPSTSTITLSPLQFATNYFIRIKSEVGGVPSSYSDTYKITTAKICEANISEVCEDYFGSPLPIRLNYFKATLKSNDLLFEWETLIEENNHFFTIEYSSNSKIFLPLFERNGSGTSLKTISYQEIYSARGFDGIVYFRLKQTDYNGEYSYSPIVAVDMSGKFKYSGLSVYPNPASDKISIDLSDDLKLPLTIQLVSPISLQTVKKMNLTTKKSIIDVSTLEDGIYGLQVVQGSMNPTWFVVQR